MASSGQHHPRHQSPYIAGIVQTAIALAVILAFAVTKQDPYSVLFAWTSAIATLGILLNQILVALAVIGFFRRTGLDRRLWHTLMSPILAAVGLTTCFILVWGNLDLLSGSDSPIVAPFPYLVLGTGLFGIVLGYYLRANKPQLYEGFGSMTFFPFVSRRLRALYLEVCVEPTEIVGLSAPRCRMAQFGGDKWLCGFMS